MWFKQGLFNVVCNLIAVGVLKLFSTGDSTMDANFWGIFFDFKLNYFLFFVVVNFIFVVLMTNLQRKKFERKGKKHETALNVVKDIAKAHKNNEVSEWGFGKYDYNAAVPVNGTWQEWISQIIKGMEKHNLEPHNFGDFYYLYDLSAGEKIEFPKDKIQRESKIGNRFLTGKILRVMPKS